MPRDRALGKSTISALRVRVKKKKKWYLPKYCIIIIFLNRTILTVRLQHNRILK